MRLNINPAISKEVQATIADYDGIYRQTIVLLDAIVMLKDEKKRQEARLCGILPKLLDGFDFYDFWDAFFEMGFDALLQRHGRHGAAHAMTLKSDFYDAVINCYEFDVSAISLDTRSYFV